MNKEEWLKKLAQTSLKAALMSSHLQTMKESKVFSINMISTKMAESRELSSWNSMKTLPDRNLILLEKTWRLTISELTWKSWAKSKKKAPSNLKICPDIKFLRTKNTLTNLSLYLIDLILYLKAHGILSKCSQLTKIYIEES